MTSARAQPSGDYPSPRGERGYAPPSLDADDGIHIASVTRIGPAGDPLLRVVVSWWEEGSWVERAVELAARSPTKLERRIPEIACAVAIVDAPPVPVGDAGAEEALLLLGVRAAAARLGLSERTLRRRYARQGARLHDRIDDLRRERTLEFLAGGLPISVVAPRLGFASPQTFARWVRRALGATATELRRRLRAGEAGGP